MTNVRGISCAAMWLVATAVVIPTVAADDTDSRLRALIAELEGPSGIVAGAAATRLGELQVEPERVIPNLIKALADDRPTQERPPFVPAWFPRLVCDDASSSLATIGEASIDPLVQLTLGTNATLRKRAVETFGRMGVVAARVMPQISELMQHDPDESVRAASLNAAVALEKDRRKLAALLTRTLSDPSPWMRIASAQTLSELGGEAALAVPHLTALLSDPVEVLYSGAPDMGPWIPHTVRCDMAQALGKIGTAARSALSPLRRMAVTDPDDGARLDAALAVCRLDPDHETEFNVIVSLAAGSAELTFSQSYALDAVAQLGRQDEQAFQRLVPLLSMPNDELTYRLLELANAIAVLGGPAAIPPLLERLRDEQLDSRDHIVPALGRFGVAAVPGFIRVLADSLKTADSSYTTYEVTWNICDQLGRIGPPAKDALPCLSYLVTHRYDGLSAQAARAIGQIGTDNMDVVRALEQAAITDDQALRDAATEALQRIRN